jgi:drug/metabolite transporter (DMT)-like permease
MSVAILQAAPLLFLAQYTFNISLALTNITSNTILSSTSSLFTFGLSVIVLKERITPRKLLCILACIAGTALVTLSDVEATKPVGQVSQTNNGTQSMHLSPSAASVGKPLPPGAAAIGDAVVLVYSKCIDNRYQACAPKLEHMNIIAGIIGMSATPV